jgi:hypothetical protein
MAEVDSYRLGQHTRALTEDLKSKMKSEELEGLEHNITAAIERNQLLTIKRSSEFIKRSTASASLKIAM